MYVSATQRVRENTGLRIKGPGFCSAPSRANYVTLRIHFFLSFSLFLCTMSIITSTHVARKGCLQGHKYVSFLKP